VTADITEDRFLGGRVVAAQPTHGFRAGHDSVLLAAAVPANDGERVLELGSGAGIASLCLAARVAGCGIMGIEIDPGLVALANGNAARNAMEARVRFTVGDAAAMVMEDAPFDHVFFNPPFHPNTGQVSSSPARDRAMRGDAIVEWTRRALELVKVGGTVTAILRADRLEEFQAAAQGQALFTLSLLPRAGEPPKRVITRIVKGRRGQNIERPGLVLHKADGSPTLAAEAILRNAARLDL